MTHSRPLHRPQALAPQLRSRPRAQWWIAGILASLLVAVPAQSEEGSATLLWNMLKQWMESVPRVATGQWSDGTVELSWESDRLSATWRGALSVGTGGAVEVPVLASGGSVTEVKLGGSAADWRVSGGVVLVRLGPDAARRADIEVTAQWPLTRTASQAAVVPLPDWARGRLSQSPDDLEVIGAESDGALPHATRALLVRTQDSLAPRIRSARYSLQLAAGVATVDLRVEVEARGAVSQIALAPSELALLDVAVDGRPVAPLAADNGDEDTTCDNKHCVEISGKGMRVITARLQVKTEGELEDLQVEMGRVAAPMTEVEVRVTGKRSVRFEPEVPVQTAMAGGQTVARAWLPPGETLTLALATEGGAVERTVKFSAEMWQVLSPAEGLLRGNATLDLAVVQGKATAVQVAVPEKVVVASVEGEGVTTWDVLAPAGDLPRRLRIGLGEEGDAAKRQIRIVFEQSSGADDSKRGEGEAPTATPPIEVPLLRTLGAFRESGAVVLLDGDKIGFAPLEGAAGWLRAGVDALPAAVRKELEGRSDQVWRHIGLAPKLIAKMAAARVHEVRLEARSSGLVRIDERTLRDSRVVVVDIKSGRTDRLVLDLPDRVGEPRVVAPSLSRMTAAEKQPDKGRKLWELRFSSALEGSVQLQVDLEQLIGADVKTLKLPDVRIRGAEVETEVLAVSAEPGLELVPTTQGETRTVPLPELPEPVARQAGRDFVAGFRSPRGPVQVELALQRRATVTTLDAFARQVWVDSHVLSDGRIASRAVALLQSAGKPVLRIALPLEAQVLAMTVDGVNVKAVRDSKGGLAVPLFGGATVRVEIRYETRGATLGLFSVAEVVAPKFDVRQGPLHWTLSLPGDLRVYRLDSDLRRDAGQRATEPPAAEKDDLVPLPVPFEARQVYLHAEVRDAQAEASVTLWLGAEPPEALGWLLVAAGAGLAALWRWRRKRKLLGAAAVLLGLGLAALEINDALDGLLDLAVIAGVMAAALWGFAKLRAAWTASRGKPGPGAPPAPQSSWEPVPPPTPPPPPPPKAPSPTTSADALQVDGHSEGGEP